VRSPECPPKVRAALGRARTAHAVHSESYMANLSGGSFGRDEALALALLGTAILWSADPVGAATLGIPRVTPAGMSGGGDSSGGEGDSSGSGGDGGGGCGGGGGGGCGG